MPGLKIKLESFAEELPAIEKTLYNGRFFTPLSPSKVISGYHSNPGIVLPIVLKTRTT